ncbi:MAG: methyltransferase domain-containing protein [Chloroflexi bacterium]|nr:methyltransferase domain-containing protein [Chloroflexota bacterium]
MSEETERFWNGRYREGEPLGNEPASLLVEHAHLLPERGRALDVAMGTGRNALYLASKGLKVTGVDVSGVAVERCLAETERLGLHLSALQADVMTLDLARESYDVIANFYFLERDLCPRLARALRPDGLLFFETFTIDQLRYGWGPRNPQWLLRPGELRSLFPDLETLLHREEVVEGKRGLKAVASLVARKPRRNRIRIA